MAVLTPTQLADIRQPLSQERDARWTKAQINAAAQAVEDTFTGAAVQTAISNAIDAAAAPLTLTTAEKRALVKHWLASRYRRGNT